MSTVANELARLIAINDNASIVRLKQEYIANNSLMSWIKLYKCANIIVNTKSYKFPDFSPQVISRSDDKTSVRCEGQAIGHNED